MKRWVALSVLVFLALPMSLAYSSDVGNLFEGSQGDFRLELGTDNFQRELNIADDITYTEVLGTDILAINGEVEGGRETVNRLFLKASYLVNPKTELYLKLGMASVRTQIDEIVITDYEESIFAWDVDVGYQPGSSVLSDPGTFFGLGVKEVLSETKDLKIALDFQILMLSETDLEMTLEGWYWEDDTGNFAFGALGIDTVKSLECQFAMLCKKTSGELKPYAGAKLTYFTNTYELFLEADDSGGFPSGRASADIEATPVDYLGFFAGVDWQLDEKTRCNLELRVSDEVGISFGISRGF